jgi:predicted transcriptional regulator
MLFPDLQTIKRRRTNLGINQKELAELAGVSQSLITKLEKNKLEPSYSIAKKIFTSLEKIEHKTEQKCKDIMTKKLISINKNAKVEKASHLLKKYSVDQIPVMDNGKVVGSVSESIVFNRMLEITKKQLFHTKVSEIMEEPFPIINADMPTSVILPLLKVSPAILVSQNKKISGIITKFNLF